MMGASSTERLGCSSSDVDEVVRDHPGDDRALQSGVALLSASIETISPFDHTDAFCTSRAPFLAIAEPALLLFALALRAFARSIGDAYPPMLSQRPRSWQSRIRRQSPPAPHARDCWDQQLAIGAPDINLVDNLAAWSFCRNSLGLPALSLRGRRHEHAENLMSVAVEDARAGLRISRSTSGNILSNSSRSPSNSLLKNPLATEGAW